MWSSLGLFGFAFRVGLIVVILCFRAAVAAAGPVWHLDSLPHVLRAITWVDIASEFRLVYNLTDECPNVLRFGMPVEDERRVGLLPMSAITEDGYPCSGASPLSLVTEVSIKQPGLLDSVGLTAMREAFDANLKAKALLDLSTVSNMIVGWHETDRACDTDVYVPSTIYLFLREDTSFRFAVRHRGQLETLTIPPNLAALLIVPLGESICLFIDPESDPSPVLLESSDPDGNIQRIELRPEDSASLSPSPTYLSTIETPSTAVSPTQLASYSPSLSPSLFSTAAASASPIVSTTSLDEPPINGAGGVTSDDSDDDDAPLPSTEETKACFPGNARVATAPGAQPAYVTMSSLRVGSRVLGSTRRKTRILLFTHRDPHAQASFIRLTFADRRSVLMLSPGHYVPLIDGTLRAANSIYPGDALIDAVAHMPRRVVSVSRVCAKGLYNPHTLDGMLSVEGTLLSAYTTAVDPRIAHSALSWTAFLLLRWHGLASWLSEAFTYGAPILASLLPGGSQSVAFS